MAVSPGPASTVLRFLRGGCSDCLCGRLCEPCRQGEGCEPSGGTVERVLPDRVVLTDGRAFRRPGGSAPRPGQTVIVDCRPGLIVRTPSAPPHGQEVGGAPFVPPPQSYDSPQRPGAWGAGVIPEVAPLPAQPPRTFTHASTGSAGEVPKLPNGFYAVGVQKPGGENVDVTAWPHARIVATVGAVELRLASRLGYTPSSSVAYDPWDAYNPLGEIPATAQSPVGPLAAIDVAASDAITRPSFELVELPEEERRGTSAVPWQELPWIYDFPASLAGGVTGLTLALRSRSDYPEFDQVLERWEENAVVGVNDAPLPDQPLVVSERRGPLLTASLYAGDDENARPWAVYVFAERAVAENDGSAYTARYWTVAREASFRRVVVLAVSKENPIRFGWYNVSSRLNSMPITRLPSPAPPWTGRSWLTPDRRVGWTAPAAGTAGTLTAYGHTFTGGTWAGLGLPVDDAQRERWAAGQPDPVQGLILHELGPAVSAVWPDGTLETCTRAAFEEALGCPPGTFKGFSPIGLGFNSWPPQWAWAITGEDQARAAVTWDAWRDSTRREWPGRARVREPPRPLPPELRPPLGVTLATTGRIPRYEEPLERYSADTAGLFVGQRPYHAPAAVQVRRDGQWVDSPQALAALDTPMLYPPARQLEVLDDRVSVRGELQILTWQGEAMPLGGTFLRPDPTLGALLIRARVRAGQLPRLTVDGVSAAVRPLGRSAGLRGWQPFLVTWGGVDYTQPQASGITLNTDVPLSRLLLTRIGLGRAPEGGGGEGG